MPGLNMQVEHHLFPSVNHCHLHRLVPRVRALCAKHKVPYPESTSMFEALKKHVHHLYIMGPLAFKKEWAKKHR
jgi:fatty acid desaturase